MPHRAFVFLACILAGFAIANHPTSSVITVEVVNFFKMIGGINFAILTLVVRSNSGINFFSWV